MIWLDHIIRHWLFFQDLATNVKGLYVVYLRVFLKACLQTAQRQSQQPEVL